MSFCLGCALITISCFGSSCSICSANPWLYPVASTLDWGLVMGISSTVAKVPRWEVRLGCFMDVFARLSAICSLLTVCRYRSAISLATRLRLLSSQTR
uniref:Putative secreted protein n=1 Tax=Ixodes ricinus TaxID=34613 RepID=A0A6B0UE30_IXORI